MQKGFVHLWVVAVCFNRIGKERTIGAVSAPPPDKSLTWINSGLTAVVAQCRRRNSMPRVSGQTVLALPPATCLNSSEEAIHT